MITDLDEALSSASLRITEGVRHLLPTRTPDEKFPAMETLQEAISYACCHGAQRFRALLSLETSTLFRLPEEKAVKLSCIVELLQSFHNIYDDLPAFDNSDTRRGKPSCHMAFDDPTTILAGVSLLSMVTDLLSSPELHDDPEIRCSLIQSFSKCVGIEGLAYGQLLDITTEHIPITQEAILELYRLKNGSLMVFCVSLSAILSKASAKKRKALEQYAQDLGVLYQLTDDILDMDTSLEDKSSRIREDVFLGKATLVNLLGLTSTRAFAEEFAETIIHHLSGFGPEADRLRHIVHYVLNRKV